MTAPDADNPRLAAALLYASWGWPIFRLTAYKTPLKGTHGHLDATTDVITLRSWFDVPRPPNLGLACGRVIALDLDGTAWATSPWGTALQAAAAAHGGLPPTLMQRTRRGLHLLYALPDSVTVRTRNEPRKKDSPGVDIKGEGGYIVLAPSINFKDKFTYHWLTSTKPAEMPQWLIEFCQTIGNDSKIIVDVLPQLGPRPAYLTQKSQQNHIGIAERSAYASKPVWSLEEEFRIRAALHYVKADGYDIWRTVGMALWWLDWIRSDGTSISFDLFDAWSQGVPEKYAADAVAAKWESFSRNARGEVTIGTLYHLARQHGWDGQAAIPESTPPAVGAQPGALTSPGGGEGGDTQDAAGQVPFTTFPPQVNGTGPVGTNGHHYPLPAQLLTPVAIRFKDTTEEGFPKATMANAAQAIRGMHVECSKDMFHEKYLVGGHPIAQWAGDLSDDAIVILRRNIRSIYGFDPGEQHTRTGATQLCLENQFDPLLQFLDGLKWDGVSRIDRWLTTYLKAPDTALNRAIARIVLVAAVRRARHPGCKFDQIVVLESMEGFGKSSAIEILAGGREYFSDQQVLGLDEKTQQEAAVGVWLFEIADLKGMRRADVEHIKAFASRKVDRARPAYGRFRIDKPRRCIYFASTNEDDYLKSDTGNRRFWPVRVGEADLTGLARDREQLWAEACAAEAAGESIVLKRELWGDARVEQDDRMEHEPWTEAIHNYLTLEKQADVTVRQVLCDNRFIQLKPEALNHGAMARAARALRSLGFTKYRRREGKALVWRYRKHVDGATQNV